MSASEEAEQERSVFEDDDEDDSDMSDDSDVNDDDGQTVQPLPRPQPVLALASALSGDLLSAFTPSREAAIPIPNSVPELNPVLYAPASRRRSSPKRCHPRPGLTLFCPF
ncbi:hypothetical protein ZIOFF_036719 [Zingiber officinale]|uniref:Uncharacterized protein n=1 Tax=Zingiber officinale TaxID=94328 RepID=A0A8J5L8S6_ZINOF|nr:hypothetical protein ZIOFF_036719 [Zingiber officinale]